MRRTKIVATLGPATDTETGLAEIIKAGVDVVRLNAAHGDIQTMERRLAGVRSAAKSVGKEVGVLVDLAGPKVRLGDVPGGTVLAEGDIFRLGGGGDGGSLSAEVSYEGLAGDVSSGDEILIDDGRVRLMVESVQGPEVVTRVVTGGPLLSHKGVNLPGVTLSVGSVTPWDEEVLDWALGTEVDWIGQSFVRCAADVDALRAKMGSRKLPIMAKIEKHEAAADIEGVVSTADGVMVARGDLAVETAAEQVPVLQRRIIHAARDAGRPVVVATEMLDSMRLRPTPTRAEASDVANAIFASADAVMLSAETAVGEYPLEAVSTMVRIIKVAESEPVDLRSPGASKSMDDVQQAVSSAACDLAADLGLAAVIPITQSGATASAVSRYRPAAPIIAATPSVTTARRLSVTWGVRSVVVDFAEDMSDLLDQVVSAVRSAGLVSSGQRVALTAGLSARTAGGTDFIHVRGT